MKALAAQTYGPLENLTVIDLPLPAPKSGEVRVKVVASALNPADYKVILGTIKFLHGRKKPLVVGYDFSGTVDALGPGVSDFAVGDEVFGHLPYGPFNQQGAFAEFLLALTSEIAKKPAGISHTICAASATGGLSALQGLRDLGRLPQGGRALITGVSGGVGSIAIGIAKRLGAHVTAVGSGSGLAMAQRLGADELRDRTTRALPGAVSDPFDVVFDAAAAYRWSQWKSALKKGGAFVTTLPSLSLAADKARSIFASSRVRMLNVKSRAADLALLASWLSAGLEVPLADTLSVRDVPAGLARLQKSGGRFAVSISNEF